MIENPLIKQNDFYKQFKVVYVNKDTNIVDNTSSIDTIQRFCSNESINFSLRNFNSLDYDEDCEHITRLPAIHMYVNDRHLGTYYPNEDPILSIRMEITIYYNDLQMRELKKNSKWWKRLIARLK